MNQNTQDPATVIPENFPILIGRRLFGLQQPMGRLAYSCGFLGLILLHYAGTVGLLWSWDAKAWTVFEYLSPFMAHRVPGLGEPRLVGLMAAWTLPFLWLAATWSIRRAREAEVATFTVLFLLVPGLNYFLILALALVPPARLDSDGQPAEQAQLDRQREEKPARFVHATEAVVAGAVAGGLIFVAAFLLLTSPYGMALFVGAPVAIGIVSTMTYNRQTRRGTASSQLIAQISLLAGAGVLLLFGVEGGICLLMTLPLAMPLAAMGSWIGDALVEPGQIATAHVLVLILASPLLTAFDSAAPEPPLREVTTRVEIAATPEQVWPNVVAFTELPPPNEIYFRLGIAYPMRARIEGQGVGAVRYCEFSTGAFVEPITRWEQPRRLSFDVVEQPATMHEWSPYDIHPQHLTESLRSERGEFRLTALPGGKTLLEGTTWYRHDLMPQLYWNLWSDTLIHGIHSRVLEHIAERSEADGGD